MTQTKNGGPGAEARSAATDDLPIAHGQGTGLCSEGRSAQITELLSAAPSATSPAEVLAEWVAQACRLGLALLLVAPGTKEPVDLRTPQQRKKDDVEAQEAAKAAGRPDWIKAKSKAGVHLATTDPEVLRGYLTRYRTRYGADAAVNLAVAVEPSRVMVVDADTAEQVQAFLTDAGITEPVAPTVHTPGAQNTDGEWVHSDGGHFWFDADGADLPAGTGSWTAPGGYAVMWGGRYVLIPPSVRPEGEYKATGDCYPIPDFLLEKVTDAGQRPARQNSTSSGKLSEGIDAWAETVSWDRILTAAEWTLAARADGCGCPTWTAPGDHASPKSATAHDGYLCTLGRYSANGNAPLHVWTDHPGPEIEKWISDRGSSTLSKFDFVAAVWHDGDRGDALTTLGLAPEPDALEAPTTVTRKHILPLAFWESRASLSHVFRASLAWRATPDATLVAVLARLAAHVPPSVRVDTGIMSPLPLHVFGGLVSPSGQGKSSAIDASAEIIRALPDWSSDPLDDHPVMVPIGEQFPREGKIRTGEGIAEMFYGTVKVPDDKGKPVNVRRQVRSNALLVTDEGAGLITFITKPESTVGETLREAWSGQAIGQSNADEAKYRFVPRGEYTLSVLTGFQVSVLANLLTRAELDKGTPQRFLFGWAKPDPSVRELLAGIENPGPLDVAIPSRPLRLCETLRRKVDEDRTAVWLEDVNVRPIESQRVAMVARVSALLAILDGRTDTDADGHLLVTEADWSLAETLFAASVAVADLVQAEHWKGENGRKQRDRETALANAIEDEEARSTPEGRAAIRIVGLLNEAGPGEHQWTGEKKLRSKFKKGTVADAALAQLVADERVTVREANMGQKFVTLVE